MWGKTLSKEKLTRENYPDRHSTKHRITYGGISYLYQQTYVCNNPLLNYDLVIGELKSLVPFRVLLAKVA